MRTLHLSISLLAFVCLTSLAGCAKSPRPQHTSSDVKQVNSISSPSQLVLRGAGGKVDALALQSGFGSSPTAETGDFDVVRAVRQAVTWHPVIREATARVSEQNNSVTEAKAGYLPTFSWGLDGLASRSDGDQFEPNANVNVSQMLYDFGKVDNRVKIASAGVAERRSQVMRSVDEIARETAYAVTELNRNISLQKVARDQIKDTKDILQLVEARAKSGAVTQSDVFQALARVQAADAVYAQISGELLRWERTLVNMTGVSTKVTNRFPAWLNSACTSREVDWSNLPASMKLDADYKAAVAQLSLSKVESYPTLSLDGGLGLGLGSRDGDRMDYTMGIKVRGSLYNGGATNARQKMAESALVTVQTTKERVYLEVRQNLDQASAQVASKASLYKTLYLKQKNLVKTKALYSKQFLELGTRTLLDLLNVDQELHAARLEAHNAEYDLHRLNIDCLFYRGKFRSSFGLTGDWGRATPI